MTLFKSNQRLLAAYLLELGILKLALLVYFSLLHLILYGIRDFTGARSDLYLSHTKSLGSFFEPPGLAKIYKIRHLQV